MANEQTNTQKDLDWLDEETKGFNTGNLDYEKLEPLKLESGKITTFTVDFSKPFNKWSEEKNGKKLTKAIIPVQHKGVKKNLWLNIKNPLYTSICKLGKTGQKEFKVSTTGSQADTKYALVEED